MAYSKAVRSCCVIGPDTFLRNAIPALFRGRFGVEALSVTPSIKGDVAATLRAQDMQDGLRAKYKITDGLAPRYAPPHDTFEYLFVAAPAYMRAELTMLGIEHAKHVLVVPPPSTQDLREIVDLHSDPVFERQLLLAYNPPRHMPTTRILRDALDAGELGPLDGLKLDILLRPPLAAGSQPCDMQTQVHCWWHRRDRGGGVLGVAGASAFDLLGFLAGRDVERVRAQLFNCLGPGDTVLDKRGTPRKIETGDTCVAECELVGGARATVRLDSREDGDAGAGGGDAAGMAAGSGDTARVRVVGAKGEAVLDFRSGVLTINGEEVARPTLPEYAGDEETAAHVAPGFVAAHCALTEALVEQQFGQGDLHAVATKLADVTNATNAVSACYESFDTSGGSAFAAVS